MSLRNFYNSPDKEKLQEYINQTMDTYALSKVYQGQDVSGIKHAKEIIHKVFVNLKNEYEEKETKEVQNESE